MSAEYQREYLVRLPLPLAQLYDRAHNAKDARARYDDTFYHDRREQPKFRVLSKEGEPIMTQTTLSIDPKKSEATIGV